MECRLRQSVENRRQHTGRTLEIPIRDQEVGGSNPLAPTNSFNNLEAADRQTAHPTAHPVPKLLPNFFAPILRAWRRTQPPTFPLHWPLPNNPLLLLAHLLLSSTSMCATSAVSRSLKR